MTEAVRTLVSSLIDYAGLFPPAKLPHKEVAQTYARHRAGEHASVLGRLIWPASALDVLTEHGSVVMPGTHATSGYQEHANIGMPWSVAVVADVPIDDCIEAIGRFNKAHASADHGEALADVIEIRIAHAGEIEGINEKIPDEVYPHFEFPPGEDPRGYAAALAGAGAGAKIRCGGVTEGAFPAPEQVADFLQACAAADIPFKATAGLHHTLRGRYRLTYEENPPTGVMFGFLNIFMGAALLRQAEIDRATLLRVLTETEASAFRFSDEGAAWREVHLTNIELAQARETFCLSYGSCSFDEPIEDLRTLGLL